jgi:hypothetical protein
MNNKKVIVCADPAGNVVVPSKNNPEWGNILVKQERIVVDDNGFARKKTISALIAGLTSELKSFGWVAGQELQGTVIFKEQLKPFNAKDPERDYKVGGATGIICTIEGQPVYRKNFYVTADNAKDVHILDDNGNIVLHDNGHEIRAAYLKLAEEQSAGIKKSEEVTLNNM